MPQPPSLTPEQRQAALEKAAEARRARAELKERLKMGSLSLSERLQQAPGNDTIGKMKVLAVLESLPGVGKVKARRTMETFEPDPPHPGPRRAAEAQAARGVRLLSGAVPRRSRS